MRQTCGQRSSMCMGSKRWALEFFFNEQISHMFLILKCREARDVGLCTFWVLAYRKPLRNAKFRFFLRAKHICFRKSPWHNFSLYANTQKHTDLDLKILYILILGTYNKLARKNISSAAQRLLPTAAALLERWPQVSHVIQDLVYITIDESFQRRIQLFIEWKALFHWKSAFVREIPNPTLISSASP